MKFVFFGAPEFAAIVLRKLIEDGFPPVAVVTNPDRPAGRKQTLTPPPVKERMKRYEMRSKRKIEVLQPESLTSYVLPLTSLNADFFIVAAYAKILPREIFSIPRLGTIGVHPSLLSTYRGASPIQSAILNGETTTGVTLYLLDEKVDHGPIIAARHLPIAARDTYETLMRRLATLGGQLLRETLPTFLTGKIKPVEQDESQATYTKKFKTEDGYVDPADVERGEKMGGDIATQIDRKIRALNPEPGVWTMRDEKRLKLLEAEITGGKLRLKKIQWEGKKPTVVQ